jgi:hypothetical protein
MNQFKRIMLGWGGMVILSNIAFYAVKEDIDKRRKKSYLDSVTGNNSN